MQNLEIEKQLLEKAKHDNAKFDGLYMYFINDVYRFSFSVLNNQHDAEDITSQTFIEFYKKLNDFEWQNVSIKYWLFRTARNLAYKKIYKKQPIELDETYHTSEEYEISFVDEIMNKDVIEKVREEILKLKPVEQELITLRIWEGLQFKEIAEITSLSENTAKKKFYRSVEKVKKALQDRNIKAFITIPALLTGMLFAGTSPSYAAPKSLASASSFSNLLITKKTTMNTMTGFLKSKAGLATIAGVLILSGTATAGYAYINRDSSRTNSTPNELALTTTPSPTTTPTTNPTLTATPTAPQVEAIKTVKLEIKEMALLNDGAYQGFDLIGDGKVVKSVRYAGTYQSQCGDIYSKPVMDGSAIYYVDKNTRNQIKKLDASLKEQVVYTLPSGYNVIGSFSVLNGKIAVSGFDKAPNFSGDVTQFKHIHVVDGKVFTQSQTSFPNSIITQLAEKYYVVSGYYKCAGVGGAIANFTIVSRSTNKAVKEYTSMTIDYISDKQVIGHTLSDTFPSDPQKVIRINLNTLAEETLINAQNIDEVKIENNNIIIKSNTLVEEANGDIKTVPGKTSQFPLIK